MSPLSVKLDRRLTRVELLNASEVAARDDAPSSSATPSLADSLKPLLGRISSELEALKIRQQQTEGQLNATAVQLASMIVERLVGKSERLNAERLQELIAEVLAGAEPPISIRIHSSVLSAMQNSIAQPFEHLVADDSVSPGECICDFSGYQLISNLNQQLESIADRLLEVIHD